MGLSSSGKALVVTMLFRLLFGGYLIAQDYYAYDDMGSALTVLGIYVLLGIFTAIFVFEKRIGLAGIPKHFEGVAREKSRSNQHARIRGIRATGDRGDQHISVTDIEFGLGHRHAPGFLSRLSTSSTGTVT